MAIGNPLSLESTVSNGIVSAIRTIANEGGRFVQITAPISPGSSGGPLFNMSGKVVGITTSHLVGGENLNFAIPINDVKPMLLARSPRARALPDEAEPVTADQTTQVRALTFDGIREDGTFLFHKGEVQIKARCKGTPNDRDTITTSWDGRCPMAGDIGGTIYPFDAVLESVDHAASTSTLGYAEGLGYVFLGKEIWLRSVRVSYKNADGSVFEITSGARGINLFEIISTSVRERRGYD